METFIVHVLRLRGAAAERSLCGEPLLFVRGAAHPYCEGVRIYYSEVKRHSSVVHHSGLSEEKRCLLCVLFDWKSPESCRKQNTQCWCYTTSFKCSVMRPNQNLHLWLVNHWRRSCRVCVCRQAGKRIHSSLFKPGKKNGIYICLYVCVHGWKWWQLTVYLYAFVWGGFF